MGGIKKKSFNCSRVLAANLNVLYSANEVRALDFDFNAKWMMIKEEKNSYYPSDKVKLMEIQMLLLLWS